MIRSFTNTSQPGSLPVHLPRYDRPGLYGDDPRFSS
jgi:hypothetical protein